MAADEEVERRFRSLAESHTPTIATYLRHRIYPLPVADLDDLIEEVLIVVWKRLDVCPPGSERAWMIGVARNVLNNARRAKRRRTRLASSLPTVDSSPSAEMWVLAAEDVRGAMEQLEAVDRETLVLHHWDGLTAREIAVALGIGVKAAESRLSRAQARLRVALGVATSRNPTGSGQ